MELLPALQFFILVIVICSNVLLALVVFKNNPKSATNIIFASLGLVISGWLGVYYLSYQPFSPSTSLFLIRLSLSFATLMSFLLFLLSHTLPSNELKFKKNNLVFLIVVTCIVAVVTLSPYAFTSVKIINGFPNPTPGPALMVFSSYILMSIVGVIYLLFSRFKRSRGKEKNQLLFIILGTVFMYGLMIFTVLIPVSLFQNSNFVSLAPFYTLLFLVMTAYAIVKHRFLDIGLIVARTVSYTFLVGLFGLMYALVFAFMSSFFVGIQIQTRAIATSTLLALVMAFSFQSIRRLLERLTDKVFYKDHYDAQSFLYRLTQIMASTLHLEDLTHLLLRELLAQMRISRGVFILVEGERVFQIIQEGYTVIPQFDNQFVSSLLAQNKILVFEELQEGPVKEMMRLRNITVAVYLKTKNEYVGLLILGEKLSGDIYSTEDIKVLQILASESSVAIENAKAYEKISHFNVTLQQEVEQATKDLKDANNRLKELDTLKDDFVSIASHELRTPMTAIRSYAWMALHKADIKLSDKMEKYLIRVLLSTERLINLVNDMLNISRIESGKIEISPEPVDLISLAKDIIDEVYYSKSMEKKINFVLLQKPVPKVFADPNKLLQVLLNLVGNSLKFTPHGGSITFDFFTDGKTVETSVKDSGVGISNEDIGRLFQKFSRLDSSYVAAATSGGTGLGLYISKNYPRIWMHYFKLTLQIRTDFC